MVFKRGNEFNKRLTPPGKIIKSDNKQLIENELLRVKFIRFSSLGTKLLTLLSKTVINFS